MRRSKRDQMFLKTGQDIFNTDSGLQYLKILKEHYVDISAVGSSPEETYYKLGQKELVQSLIASLKDEESLEEIVIPTGYID